MEENTQGEQSQISENNMELAKQEMNETENKKEDIARNFDSPYGKFKDAKSLLSAYNSLEAEFTRKSQKLASLLSSGNTLSKDNDALQSQKTTINNSENNGEQISASENKESAIKFKQSGWKKQVSDFFEQNPEAKTYSKDIANILLNNKQLSSIDGCLDIAYKMVKSDKAQEPASLAKNEDFLKKYIIDNPRAKELIIDNYINSLNNFNVAPKLISGQTKEITATTKNKVGSLEKARELTLKLFN